MNETIVFANVVGNEFHVIRRIPSNMALTSNPPIQCPDKLIKEIYQPTLDGGIKLVKTINGSVVPQKYIPESFNFDE